MSATACRRWRSTTARSTSPARWPSDATQDIRGQTAQVLAAVDKLLAEAGTDKAHILMCQIFLADMADFAAMNEVWDDWVAPGDAPPRATVQANLARPEWKVEMVVTAAL